MYDIDGAPGDSSKTEAPPQARRLDAVALGQIDTDMRQALPDLRQINIGELVSHDGTVFDGILMRVLREMDGCDIRHAAHASTP